MLPDGQSIFWFLVPAVILAALLLASLIIYRRRKKPSWRSSLLRKWQKHAPEAAEIVHFLPLAGDEDKAAIGKLAEENCWCEHYVSLLGLGREDENERAILLLWPLLQDRRMLISALMSKLAAPEQNISMSAAAVLNKANDEAVLPYLLAAVCQRDKYLPARLSDALSGYGVRAAAGLACLFGRPDNDEDGDRRILALLGELEQACPLPVVEKAMLDSRPAIRLQAAAVVGRIHPPQAVNFIRPLLYDEEPLVRAAAATALIDINSEGVVAALYALKKRDSDWRVITTCQAFLGRWEKKVEEQAEQDEADLWLQKNSADKT